MGFLTQDDIDKLGNNDEPYDSTLISNLAAKLGPDQQASILNHLQQATGTQISFRKYKKTKGKSLEAFVSENDSSEPIDQEIPTKYIYLHENGNASELVFKEELVESTLNQLKAQIAYSNECEPPSVYENPDWKAKIYMPGFLKQYVDNRLPVFVENALQAITMKKDREYMIYEDRDRLREGSSPNAESHHFHRIIPVDFKVSCTPLDYYSKYTYT